MKPQWQRMGHAAEPGSFTAVRMNVAREVYAERQSGSEPRVAWRHAWFVARIVVRDIAAREAADEARMAAAYAEWVAAHPEEWGNPADEENY